VLAPQPNQGFPIRLATRNAVPAQQFSQFATADVRQRVKPVKAGDCILHLDIVQPACGQNEPFVSKPSRQFDACCVDIAESQPKSQASGSQAFARTGLPLRHDTTLSACNVPAEVKTFGQRYESHPQSRARAGIAHKALESKIDHNSDEHVRHPA